MPQSTIKRKWSSPAGTLHCDLYIRGYPSKAERDRRLTAAHDDPEFAEVVTKQERNADTKLIVKAHNIDMVPNGSYSAIKIVP